MEEWKPAWQSLLPSSLLFAKATGTALTPETHLTLQPESLQCGWMSVYHNTVYQPSTPAQVTLSAKLGARAWCGTRQKDGSASSYHIFVNELAQILKAVLFRDGVWVVAILVGYAVGLQCSRACKQQGSKVLQPVSCREVKQCW